MNDITKGVEMKRIMFIMIMFLLPFFKVTPLISVAEQEYDLDLQMLIAGIKNFDAATTTLMGEFVFNHKVAGFTLDVEYAFAFSGITYEEVQARVDYHRGSRVASSEIYDGERHWEIYENKKPLFIVDISADDMKVLRKPNPQFPKTVKQAFKEHKIKVSDNLKIEEDEESEFFKIIDKTLDHIFFVFQAENSLEILMHELAYGVRPISIIDPQLDPRCWTTYGPLSTYSYLMTPLSKMIEKYESEIIGTEVLNGIDTYIVNVKHPITESLKLWICPEKGFRLVKLKGTSISKDEDRTSPFKKGTLYITERDLSYKEYLPGIWFPEKIVETIHPSIDGSPDKKGNMLGKTTLQTIKCKLNTDVSSLFQLDIPNDTLVFDHGIRKLRKFSELKQPSQ